MDTKDIDERPHTVNVVVFSFESDFFTDISFTSTLGFHMCSDVGSLEQVRGDINSRNVHQGTISCREWVHLLAIGVGC